MSNTSSVRSEDNNYDSGSFPESVSPTAFFLYSTQPVKGGELQDFRSYNLLQGSYRLQITLLKRNLEK
jgi:hypothetical protein